jgi:predicted Mrr-cat superfamily restriction endonuclease
MTHGIKAVRECQESDRMNLFQMKSKPHGIERLPLFLKDNFVCIGWPGIGNLDNVSTAELEQRLTQAYDQPERDLAGPLSEISCFAQTMQDGDYVLIADEDGVYLGDVGDYYYVEPYDNIDDGMCHRRGVTWLNRIPRAALNLKVQEWLQHSGTIEQFEQAVEAAGLDSWIPNRFGFADTPAAKPPVQQVSVDPDTVARALAVLNEALSCDNAERRERAAIAILQYARQANHEL